MWFRRGSRSSGQRPKASRSCTAGSCSRTRNDCGFVRWQHLTNPSHTLRFFHTCKHVNITSTNKFTNASFGKLLLTTYHEPHHWVSRHKRILLQLLLEASTRQLQHKSSETNMMQWCYDAITDKQKNEKWLLQWRRSVARKPAWDESPMGSYRLNQIHLTYKCISWVASSQALLTVSVCNQLGHDANSSDNRV